MDVDAALAEVRRRAAGRTRYEGQPPSADEVLAEEVERLRAALEFYADPETYFGIAFLADPPCGGFAEDFSDDHGDDTLPGPRPGARARRALENDRG